MRNKLRHLIWSIFWDIGDYFLWKAHKIEPDSGKGETLTLREPLRFVPTNQPPATVSTGTTWTITSSTIPGVH